MAIAKVNIFLKIFCLIVSEKLGNVEDSPSYSNDAFFSFS